MKLAIIRPFAIWLATAALLLGAPLAAAGEEQSSAEETEAREGKVQEEVDQELVKRRRAMMKEAQAALAETNAALGALDEGKNQEALEALARATGKLELIVARDPALAVAPVGARVVTYDLYATPEAIRTARDTAEDLLEAGKVQGARALLSGLASEMIIRIDNLPLATYPEAIKAVSPLIDEGRIEEAKTGLRAALNTLVVTDSVIPLPVLRARVMLEEAEELAKKDAPSKEDQEKVNGLVKSAREQLEMADLLGYGEEDDHKEFRDQIAELEQKISGEEDTQGVFAGLRKFLEDFQASYLE